MKAIFSALFCLIVILASGQSGNFFLSHYSPSKDRLDNICFQVQQHENGIMYFATRGGMLQFDGKAWELLKGTGAIYTMQISKNGKIFWGGAHGYGVVAEDEANTQELKPLSTGTTDVFQSVMHEGRIFFLTSDKVIIVDEETLATTNLDGTSETGAFSGISLVSGAVIVTTAEHGLFRVSGAKLGSNASRDRGAVACTGCM